ncbi:S8 family serine peptidase [Anaerobacillus sp. MEB173]|uniref:S8 family peptidase n=1 Tax=Anaerobacillus sp. MEB173 TaxID=3383345 RepID=UPI003F900E03
MKKTIYLLLLLSLLVLFPSFSTDNRIQAETGEFERVIITFHDKIYDHILIEGNGEIHHRFPSISAVAASIPSDYLSTLQHHPRIKSVEVDKQVSVTQTIDWGVHRTNAPQVWKNSVTGKGVKVALIDTGIAKNHPDLKIADAVAFTNYTTDYNDDNGHGTHVAGIVAAQNNDIGTAGMAPDIDLYIAKALDQEGNGYHSDLVRAIEWAINKDVDIINLSAGGIEGSLLLKAAIDQAYNKGVLIVAAAGNSGQAVEYPAAYSNVIAVAAVDQRDRRTNFSAIGKEVEVSAPGVAIYSTYLRNSYKSMSGTSMAAPHVTGMLALLKQARPGIAHTDLRELLHKHTFDLGETGKDELYGYGRIEVPQDLKVEKAPPSPPTSVQATMIDNKTDSKLQVQLTWKASESVTGIESYQLYRNGEWIAKVGNQTFTYIDIVDEGTYSYEIIAIDRDKQESNRSQPIKIEVKRDTKIDVIVDDPILLHSFKDVTKTDWFAPHVDYLTKTNIIGGYEDGTFQPNNEVTRAEAITMIGRHLGINGARRATDYSDVSSSHFASGFIQSAQEQNLLAGYKDGTFRPNRYVTRGELAVLFVRAFSLNKAATITFSDVSPTYYAHGAIQRLVGENITAGYPDGTFKPNQPVTRAEFSVLLTRAINDQFKLK